MSTSDTSSDTSDPTPSFSSSDSSSGSDSGNDRTDTTTFHGRLADDVELKVKSDEPFRIRYHG